MYGQTHVGLGWVVGVLAPGSDRRLRAWCTAAAILPDVDAGAMLFGMDAYVRWHHKPGHNVFLGAACVLVAAVHFWSRPLRQRCLAVALVALCWALQERPKCASNFLDGSPGSRNWWPADASRN
jgi:hypothetical protein